MNQFVHLPLGLDFLRSQQLPHKIGVLDRIYGRSLAKQGEKWVKINSKIDWKLDLTDTTQRWIIYDSYENKNVISWIRSWFKNGGVAIETGPNVGQTMLYYADLANLIIAIDPLKSAIDWLEQCIEHNQLSNIKLLNNGVSNKATTLQLQQAGAQSTFRGDWYTTKGHQTVDIHCFPLDEIAKQHQLEKIRLWKLDVEGMDIEALEGAEKLLSKQQIEAIYIEITGGNFDKVSKLLKLHNYGLFNIDENTNPVELVNPQKEHTHSYIALPIAA